MLELTPSKLMDELRASERLRDAHLEIILKLVAAYHGRFFSSELQDGDPKPKNHNYEYISLILAQIVYENPECSVESMSPAISNGSEKAIQHGVNRWAKQINLRRKLVTVAHDMLFGFGVLQTYLSPDRANQQLAIPQCKRIAPHRFIRDHRAIFMDDGERYSGHMWLKDKADLLKNPKFNPDVVESIAKDAGLDAALPKGKAKGPSRGEIVGYDIWVPEVTPEGYGEPEYNGSIYTLAYGVTPDGDATEAKWLRDPRPYFGPRCGPYTLFGVHVVPDQAYPLSPLAAVFEQTKEHNAHAAAAARDAAARKKFLGFDSSNQEAGRAAKMVKNGEVVGLPDLQKGAVQQFELGGVSPQQYEYLQYLQDQVDRVSGLNEAMRGNITGDPTATEVSAAQSGSSVRVETIRSQFRDSVKQVMTTAGFLMNYSEHVQLPLGPQAAKELGMVNPVLLGGIHENEDPRAFNDFEFVVDPYSMPYTSDVVLQKRGQDTLALVAQYMPMVAQFPTFPWGEFFDDIGQMLNNNNLGSYFEAFIANQQQMMAQQAAMMPPPPMGGPTDPGAVQQQAVMA